MVSLGPSNAGPDPVYAPGGGWTSSAHNNSAAATDRPLSFPAEHVGVGVSLTNCTGHLHFFFSERAGGSNAASFRTPTFFLSLPIAKQSLGGEL